MIFYTVNAFVHFTFMDMTMTPVAIALFEHSFPSGNGYRAVPVYFKDREAGMLAC